MLYSVILGKIFSRITISVYCSYVKYLVIQLVHDFDNSPQSTEKKWLVFWRLKTESLVSQLWVGCRHVALTLEGEVLKLYVAKCIYILRDISCLQFLSEQCSTICGLQIGYEALLLRRRHITPHRLATRCPITFRVSTFFCNIFYIRKT